MISSSWFLFHKEIVKIKHYLEKSFYSLGFVDKQIKFLLENKTNEKRVAINATNSVVRYYKLPYIVHISTVSNVRLIVFANFFAKV